MKKLCDLVKIEENNMECVLLKIKKDSMMDLIKLGCFNGDEKLIRVTKGSDHTITVWSDNGCCSWDWGDSGCTLVSNQLIKIRNIVVECIQEDFGIYIDKDKSLIAKTINIKSTKDVINKKHIIDIIYRDCEEDRPVVVYLNGVRLNNFVNKIKAVEYLNDNYILVFNKLYVDQADFVTETYTATKKIK